MTFRSGPRMTVPSSVESLLSMDDDGKATAVVMLGAIVAFEMRWSCLCGGIVCCIGRAYR